MAEPATDIFGGLDVDRIVRGAMPQATVNVPKVQSGLKEVGREEAAAKGSASDRMIGDLNKDVTGVHKAYEGIDPVDVKPWDAAKAKEQFSTDPVKEFGSLGMIAVTLASAFTRQPMINSLNAAGSYLEARNKKNDKDMENAYKAWKDNTELAIKRHDMQRQGYDDAIKLMNVDRTKGAAELEALAAKFGDKRTQVLLEGGYIKELIDYQNSQRQAYAGMAQMLPQLETLNAKRQAEQYLTEQGKNPAEIYHEIYAPAYSNTIGNLKAQMIRDKIAGGAKVEDAIRETEASFKPADAAKTVGPKYAQEFIEGVEKDGIALRPETKKLIQDTIGTTAKSGKTQETTARVAQAAEEIRQRKNGDQPLKEGEADQIIRDAVATETPQKIDQAIINQLPQYEGMDRRKLGYIGPKSQERILNSIQSAEQIEHIADYAAANPETVGLIADAARKINVDAYKGMITNPSAYIAKITQDRDSAIDAEAKNKGLSPDVASKAKVLNKMLATQAFADAAQAGSRGATIYLDKAFREIYQQASSLPAFFDILHVRQRDADMNLGRYNLDLDKRKDGDQHFKFWKDPESYLTRAATPKAKAGQLPPKDKLVVGSPYQTAKGPRIWGGDAFYTEEEWATRSK